MHTPGEYRSELTKLFTSQRLAVLATQHGGAPYANLVAFAASEDLALLLFVTPRATRKYKNLRADGRAAVLIDNRQNNDADFHAAIAATALGASEELEGERRARMLARFVDKHPYLAEFTAAPSAAVFAMAVEKYIVVDHFQRVVEIDVSQWTS